MALNLIMGQPDVDGQYTIAVTSTFTSWTKAVAT